MEIFMVSFSTIQDVQKFVAAVNMIDSDCDLVASRYVVDAKSILGILSLDISKPIELRIYSYKDEMKQLLQDFIVEE